MSDKTLKLTHIFPSHIEGMKDGHPVQVHEARLCTNIADGHGLNTPLSIPTNKQTLLPVTRDLPQQLCHRVGYLPLYDVIYEQPVLFFLDC